MSLGIRSFLLAAFLLFQWGLPFYAAEMDDLLGDGNDTLDGEMGLDEPTAVISDAEVKKRLTTALAEQNAEKRRTALVELLNIFRRQKNTVLVGRDLNRFMNAVLDSVPPKTLRGYVSQWVKSDNDLQFDPGRQLRLNMGIRFALVAGGVSADQLQTLMAQYPTIIDLEWALPTLGRAGGKKVIATLRKYRQDAVIIPLGNYRNIRRIPCAAVLACAYAGDAEAFATILKWYEQDFTDRPRFAFYVTWAKSEGMKVDYRLLDYCDHRIRQAERFLAFLGQSELPHLVTIANRDLSLSLTAYLLRQLAARRGSALAPLIALIKHPCMLVKQRLLRAVLQRGTGQERQILKQQITALLTSPRGSDRLFAVKALFSLEPDSAREIMEGVLKKDPNRMVRIRLAEIRSRMPGQRTAAKPGL